MSNEITKACPICKEPYKVYAFYAGDQSACPDCVKKAEKKHTNLNWQRLTK